MDETERAIQQLRVDARALQEDAEAAVAELARATRNLRDAVLDHARSGARFRIEVGDVVFAGQVVHVGDDVVRLVVGDRAPVDLAISAVRLVRSSPGETASAPVSVGYPATLLARCRELLQVSASVELGRRTGTPLLGSLVAATSTHVELAGRGAETMLVPLGEVAWVSRSDVA